MNALTEIIFAADRINVIRAEIASYITDQGWQREHRETQKAINYMLHVMAYRYYINLDKVIQETAA